MAFTYKLEQQDGTPADPPTLRTAVPTRLLLLAALFLLAVALLLVLLLAALPAVVDARRSGRSRWAGRGCDSLIRRGERATLCCVAPPIGYVKNGEVNVAYQIVGDGPRDLLMIPGWVSHLAMEWEEPTWVRFIERLMPFARVIRFDKRGTGLSDRPPGIPTLEERMEDARAVLDAVGSERAHVLGWSEGGALGILLAASHPDRVQSLVLYGTMPCSKKKDDYPWGDEEVVVEEELRMVEEQWGTDAFAELFAPRGDERYLRWWSAYSRAAASPSAA